MRNYLIEFLKMLEAAIPPPVNCHHALTYAQYGSDADGWQDKLALQINLLGDFHCFFFDEDDLPFNLLVSEALGKGSAKLVSKIARELSVGLGDNVQPGVSMGQYLSIT